MILRNTLLLGGRGNGKIRGFHGHHLLIEVMSVKDKTKYGKKSVENKTGSSPISVGS